MLHGKRPTPPAAGRAPRAGGRARAAIRQGSLPGVHPVFARSCPYGNCLLFRGPRIAARQNPNTGRVRTLLHLAGPPLAAMVAAMVREISGADILPAPLEHRMARVLRDSLKP